MGVRLRRSKLSPNRIFVVVLFIAFLVAVVSIQHFLLGIKPPVAPIVLATSHKSLPAPTTAVIYRGLPTRLRIPIIHVDVAIDYMGNTSKGDMAAPVSATTAGWYKYGAIPGETGSAVMAGHVVGPKGEPGVFYHLDKLQTGDILQVVDAKGQVASFAVREVRKYDESQQHAEIFNSTSGAHLNLITCAGDWDAARHEYLQRLVVFADETI